jgi:hypothetical protein
MVDASLLKQSARSHDRLAKSCPRYFNVGVPLQIALGSLFLNQKQAQLFSTKPMLAMLAINRYHKGTGFRGYLRFLREQAISFSYPSEG